MASPFQQRGQTCNRGVELLRPRQVTPTARRHGITRFQLNHWRKAAREGRLGNGRGE
nr:transposase [Sinorhizobium sp. BJ1]